MTPEQIEALRAAAARPKAERWIQTEKQQMPDGQELSVQVRPEKGDELIGTVVAKSVGTSKFTDHNGNPKRYPIVEIEDADGKLWVVFGHGAFLADLFGVEVGDAVIIRYEGLGEAKAGRKPPKVYKVAAIRDGQPVRLSSTPPPVADVVVGDAPALPGEDGNPFDVGGGQEPF